jgi:hypothetical protein
MGNSV